MYCLRRYFISPEAFYSENFIGMKSYIFRNNFCSFKCYLIPIDSSDMVGWKLIVHYSLIQVE